MITPINANKLIGNYIPLLKEIRQRRNLTLNGKDITKLSKIYCIYIQFLACAINFLRFAVSQLFVEIDIDSIEISEISRRHFIKIESRLYRILRVRDCIFGIN